MRSQAVRFSLSSITKISTGPVYGASPSGRNSGCWIFLLISFRSPDFNNCCQTWPTSSVNEDQPSATWRSKSSAAGDDRSASLPVAPFDFPSLCIRFTVSSNDSFSSVFFTVSSSFLSSLASSSGLVLKCRISENEAGGSTLVIVVVVVVSDDARRRRVARWSIRRRLCASIVDVAIVILNRCG